MDQAQLTTLYITKSKIWADETQFDWGGGDLGFILRQIKNRWGGNQIRVILGQEVSKVWTWEIPEEKLVREYLLEQAKNYTAEDLALYHVSWKVVKPIPNQKTNLVEVIAVYPGLWENLEFVAKENGLEVISIEPIAKILAAQQAKGAAKLIYWQGWESVAVVAKEGFVYLAENLGANPEQDLANLRQKARGLGINVGPRDEIRVQQTPTRPPKQSKATVSTNKSKLLSYGVMGLLSLAVIVVMGGIGLKFKQDKTPQPLEKPQVEIVTLTPSTVAPTTVMAELKVQVLNGSGKAGEAKKAADLLISLGVKEIVTGNAKTYDYTMTQVRSKLAVADNLKAAIVDKLATTYQVEEGDQLEDASEQDVVVMVGSLTTK